MYSWTAFKEVFLGQHDLPFSQIPGMLYILHSLAEHAQSSKAIEIVNAVQTFVQNASQQPTNNDIFVLLQTFKLKAHWVTKYLNVASGFMAEDRSDPMVSLEEAMDWWN